MAKTGATNNTELARALDVDRVTIYRWRHGLFTPGLPMAQRIADMLGCTVDDILERAA